MSIWVWFMIVFDSMFSVIKLVMVKNIIFVMRVKKCSSLRVGFDSF